MSDETEAEADPSGEIGAGRKPANGGDIRLWLSFPFGERGSLEDFQQEVETLLDGVMRTNLQAIQQLMQAVDPAAVAALQRRFVHDYLAALLEGTASLTRAVQLAAEAGQHRVSAVMHRPAPIASPEMTVRQAAWLMRADETGLLAVCEDGRLVGALSADDVTLRVVAEGRDAARTTVREVMTADPAHAVEHEQAVAVAARMAKAGLCWLTVVSRELRPVGVVSLGALAGPAKPP